MKNRVTLRSTEKNNNYTLTSRIAPLSQLGVQCSLYHEEHSWSLHEIARAGLHSPGRETSSSCAIGRHYRVCLILFSPPRRFMNDIFGLGKKSSVQVW